jgi:hypothetical protein
MVRMVKKAYMSALKAMVFTQTMHLNYGRYIYTE